MFFCKCHVVLPDNIFQDVVADVSERAQMRDRDVTKCASGDAGVEKGTPISMKGNASDGRHAGKVGTGCRSQNSLALVLMICISQESL